jgi:glycerol-3-phosphate cytidylyltransferase
MSRTKQTVGITFSAFDLLHAGHVLMLQEARLVCDYLIACLHIDPSIERPNKNRPIQSVEERYIQLEAIKYVDEIRMYSNEEDILKILDEVRPDYRIIGEDYKGKDFTGKQFCEENNIKIFYNSRNHGFSSSELRERIANVGK